jgi:hypothetical protein
MDSNKKKAMLYHFVLFFTDAFHDSKTQTGIKNVVRIIINKAIPSIPKTIELFDNINQSNFSTN